jgi:hypothetical protein
VEVTPQRFDQFAAALVSAVREVAGEEVWTRGHDAAWRALLHRLKCGWFAGTGVAVPPLPEPAEAPVARAVHPAGGAGRASSADHAPAPAPIGTSQEGPTADAQASTPIAACESASAAPRSGAPTASLTVAPVPVPVLEPARSNGSKWGGSHAAMLVGGVVFVGAAIAVAVALSRMRAKAR